MSGKTTYQYRKLFSVVKQKLFVLTGRHWMHERIKTEYERGVISTLETGGPVTLVVISISRSHYAGTWRSMAGKDPIKTLQQ